MIQLRAQAVVQLDGDAAIFAILRGVCSWCSRARNSCGMPAAPAPGQATDRFGVEKGFAAVSAASETRVSCELLMAVRCVLCCDPNKCRYP